MTRRLPLVMVDGKVRELPSTDVAGTGFSEDGMIVAKEVIFAGQAVQSFTNGQKITLDGVEFGVSIANGATSEIDANGLKNTFPTSGEMFFATTSAALFSTYIGASRLRRGHFALWTRVANYSFAATASAYVHMIAGANYPAHCWGMRRLRNLEGGANTATGSLGMWGMWNGSDFSSVLAGAPTTVGNGNTSHEGTHDVCCTYWRSPVEADFYYGTYSGGWPAFSELTFGASMLLRANVVAGFNKWRDPASTWGMVFGSGSGGNSNSNYITIDRWRLTYWDP